jgi:hypothetical protein
MRGEDPPELDERADDLNARLDGDSAVEDAGQHDRAMLGEYQGRRPSDS